GTEAMGFAARGREAQRGYGKYVRACVGPEFFAVEYARVRATWDAAEAARSVAAPTLVTKDARVQWVTMEMTRDLVALIPNAQLAVLEGYVGETWVQRAMDFLNGVSEKAQRSPELPSGMTAILFADIVDSTALTERLGDAAFRAKARDVDSA